MSGLGFAAAAVSRFYRSLRRGGVVQVSAASEPGPASPFIIVLCLACVGGAVLNVRPAEAGFVLSQASGLSLPSGITMVEFGPRRNRTTAERAEVCAMMMELAEKGGALSAKVAAVAGIVRPGPSGPEFDGTRLSPRMTSAQFDGFARAHEEGHCRDATMPAPSAIMAMDPHEREYMGLLWESFADAWAVIAQARNGGGPDVAREWADLRAVSVLMNGVRRNGGDAWARYQTAPVVDAAVAWVTRLGPAATALSDDQAMAAAHAIVREAAPSRASWESILASVPEIRLSGGQALLPPSLPVGFVRRLEAALSRTGVTPVAKDFTLSPVR